LANIKTALDSARDALPAPEPERAFARPQEPPNTNKIKPDQDFYLYGLNKGIWDLKPPGSSKSIDLFAWRNETEKITPASFKKYVKRVRAVLDPSNCEATGLDQALAIEANEKFEEKVKLIMDKPAMYQPFPGALPSPSGDWIIWYCVLLCPACS
jgi:hypothetical protein